MIKAIHLLLSLRFAFQRIEGVRRRCIGECGEARDYEELMAAIKK